MLPHFVPMLRDTGMPPQTAAEQAGVIGLSVITSRVVVGLLADVTEAPWFAAAACAISAIACVTLALGVARVRCRRPTSSLGTSVINKERRRRSRRAVLPNWRCSRPLRSICEFSRSQKPKEQPRKSAIIDSAQDLHHRDLNDFIFQREDAERPQAAIDLGMYVRAYRQRPIATAVDPVSY
jgi:hypothetical protein